MPQRADAAVADELGKRLPVAEGRIPAQRRADQLRPFDVVALRARGVELVLAAARRALAAALGICLGCLAWGAVLAQGALFGRLGWLANAPDDLSAN